MSSASDLSGVRWVTVRWRGGPAHPCLRMDRCDCLLQRLRRNPRSVHRAVDHRCIGVRRRPAEARAQCRASRLRNGTEGRRIVRSTKQDARLDALAREALPRCSKVLWLPVQTGLRPGMEAWIPGYPMLELLAPRLRRRRLLLVAGCGELVVLDLSRRARRRVVIVRRETLGALVVDDHIGDGDPSLVIDGERFWVRLWDDQRAKGFLRACSLGRDDH